MKSDKKKKKNSKYSPINTKPQLPGVYETGNAVANTNLIEYLKKSVTHKPLFKRKKTVTESLRSKSEKSGIPMKIVVEVFKRGVSAWDESMKINKVQNGFNRVNSYIAGGKARELDADITEVKKPVPVLTREQALIKKIKGQLIK